MYKKGKWPNEYKREVVLSKITNLDVIQRSGDILSFCMSIVERVGHSYVKDIIVPRGERRMNVGIIATIYVLNRLEGEPLNLPWIMMRHMEHTKTKP